MKRHPIIEGVMADIEGLDFADDEKRQGAEESIICTVQTLIDRLATADAAISASQEEITRLRKALIACGRNVGAFLADDVSTDFLLLVPEEVRLVIEKFRPNHPHEGDSA